MIVTPLFGHSNHICYHFDSFRDSIDLLQVIYILRFIKNKSSVLISCKCGPLDNCKIAVEITNRLDSETVTSSVPRECILLAKSTVDKRFVSTPNYNFNPNI